MGKNLVVNLSNVVATPVLTGKNENYMWTGVVKSNNINSNIIQDNQKR